MSQAQTTNFIEPRIFRLLMKIMDHISLHYYPGEMSKNQLITAMATEIREASDAANLQLFKIDSNFYIYPKNSEPILFPKRSFEKFLLMVGDQIGLDKETLLDHDFRDGLFGACWRLLAPET